ncbi:MAG TPA: glycosyltransferase [Polyangia bacterium]|nr:glycosyltransferase [Polyangia bacterium]
MRVLFINDTARNGGPGRSLHAILRYLDPGRVHRAVLLPRPGEVSDLLSGDAVADDLLFEPRWVENIFEPWSRAMARADFAAAWPVRWLRACGNSGRMAAAVARTALRVRRGGYHLIYCNGTVAGVVGGLVARSTGVPALWHVRYTSLPPAVRPLHDWLASSRAVRRIVCVSAAAAEVVPECAHKTAVIHNGVDTDAFAPARVPGRLRQELGLPPGAVVFGSHGRVLRRKGYLELVRAACVARGLMTEEERRRCYFVVVGDTPQDFRPDHVEECRALAAELGAAERVLFLGFRADVRPYLADWDVAIVPSVYPDPLPRAVIESMAFGKPVIAYDVGGVREMLAAEEGQEVGALLPKAGDLADLARAILRYLRDPALRARQGEAARRRAVRDFGAAAHAARIHDQILRAAGRGPATATAERAEAAS